jgi:hypothetical protein
MMEKMPKPPRFQIRYDDLNEADYPILYSKYRIVKVYKNQYEHYFQPQLKRRYFIFFYTWVDIGPLGCESLEEAHDWIMKICNRVNTPKREIVWSVELSNF